MDIRRRKAATLDRIQGTRDKAKRAKAPAGCYWRWSTLWGCTEINGRRYRWSLDTDDPAIARKRFEAGKARLVADVRHGDGKRSLKEALVTWEAYLTRQVVNGALGQKTKTRYLCRSEEHTSELQSLR